MLIVVIWGLTVSPFNWSSDWLPKDPVRVDAIPDLGENQQIVEVKWAGRSPQDIENQITFPLSSQLLGVAGVKTVRSTSMPGFSSIFVIFEEGVDFYWSRSRILEKLNSIPLGTLPTGVTPSLGPDATGMGQVFWYTLEGRDSKTDLPLGNWDVQELRSYQDFTLKYALSSVDGVSEVASVGGYVKEYQIEINPLALQQYDISIMEIATAVKNSNRDAGARTIEINKVEYFVRGLGYIKSIQDIEKIPLKSINQIPVLLKDVANVQIGPAQQKGFLDKNGVEAVGGVVIARYGANPMEVIQKVKVKLEELKVGMPEKILADGSISKLAVVPFYDRTGLIKETLATLEDALILQVLVTIVVVLLLLMEFRASLLVSSMLPISVLSVFIAMKYANVDANIVALSGIAIAVGTMVDMGIILTENIISSMDEHPEKSINSIVLDAVKEVSSAIITAVSTTIVSFLPVYTMIGAEGKLFKPLAYTKTFALISSILAALLILPVFARWLLGIKITNKLFKAVWNILLIVFGFVISFKYSIWLGILLILTAGTSLVSYFYLVEYKTLLVRFKNGLIALLVSFFLAEKWLPLGTENSILLNAFFVFIIISLVLGLFALIIHYYESFLNWALNHRMIFLSIPFSLIVFALLIWFGWRSVIFPFSTSKEYSTSTQNEKSFVTKWLDSNLSGLGKEFMPNLDEGSFLFMPTVLPHSGVELSKEYLSLSDVIISNIPEVISVVGKAGRAETSLDPAPISMFETVINYKAEYISDDAGRKLKVKFDSSGNYIEDPYGTYVRQWRDHIKNPDDIWNEIVKQVQLPGLTSAPKLQPIETRIVMLQSGMRSAMGIKLKGTDLSVIEKTAKEFEQILKSVPGIESATVFAERSLGKPYLEIDWNRDRLARYGLSIEEMQQFLETAVGGSSISMSLEGRERYPIRIRYNRASRNQPEKIEQMLFKTKSGAFVKLEDLAQISYNTGPEMIRSEDTFLTTYIVFGKKNDWAELDVIHKAQEIIQQHIDKDLLKIPAGMSYEFAGTYENQVRAEKRLQLVIPLVLGVIFLILYVQFKTISTSLMIFSSIFVAWSGGFLMLWLYGQTWFMNFELLDISMRALFQMGHVNLSVAVWVGFIALFGIASDDSVLIATYLTQKMEKGKPENLTDLKALVIEAGKKRVRPALMTSATTILALLPVLSSSGKGSDIMVPMAIPTFGGMIICLITLFLIPVLYYSWNSRSLTEKDEK